MTVRQFQSTAAAIAWYARHAPGTTAVVEDGRSITYAALARDVGRCARSLQQAGVRPGMLVGLEIRRARTVMLVLLLSCEVIGAATAPTVRADLRADDVIVPHCDLLLLTVPPDVGGLPPYVLLPDGAIIGDTGNPSEPADEAALNARVDLDALVRVSRTSGTTGRPKSVPTTARSQRLIIEANIDVMPPSIRQGVRFLCLYNFGIRHVHIRILAVLTLGGTVIFGKEEQAPGLLASGAVNHILLMPGEAERVAEATPPSPHVASIFVAIGGGHAGPALRRLVQERLGAMITTSYASNETNYICLFGDDGIGTLVAGAEVRIVGDDGRSLPFGETGVIEARTASMCDGYFNDAAATAAAFVDGWFHTGDAGIMLGPDRLQVLGRIDDLLNVGGVKVAPLPIEERIKAIPGIADAVVMTVASANEVGRLVAAIEVPGGALPDAAADAVRAILAGYVNHFDIQPLPWFPRTDTGKVRRQDLQDAWRGRRTQATGSVV